MKNWLLRGLVVLVAWTLTSCAVVPQNRRANLADPLMTQLDDDLDQHRKQKMYDSREAAAGGHGKRAGGGCGCQ